MLPLSARSLFTPFSSAAPVVESTGAEVEILAVTEAPDRLTEDPVTTPVLCRQGSVLVAAFHPELTADRRVHGLFVTMIEERGR